jgi:hypothetical protein
LHLQAELLVRVAIPLDVFHCVFQFDAMALQKGVDFHPGLVTKELSANLQEAPRMNREPRRLRQRKEYSGL